MADISAWNMFDYFLKLLKYLVLDPYISIFVHSAIAMYTCEAALLGCMPKFLSPKFLHIIRAFLALLVTSNSCLLQSSLLCSVGPDI